MRQDNFEVLPGAFSGVRFNAPQVGDAGAQASAFGRAASGAGESMAAFALKMQQEVNGTRAQAADNVLSAAYDELLYHPESGLLNQRGLNALQRESGMPLAEEYGQALRAKYEEVAAGLGNDAQREMLRQSYEKMAAGLNGKALAHTSDEFRRYRSETAQATVDNRGNALAAGWRDDADVDGNARDLAQAVLSLGQMNGWDGEQLRTELTQAGTRFFSQAVMNALDANDTARAQALLDRFRPGMAADAVARLEKALQGQRDEAAAFDGAQAVINGVHDDGSIDVVIPLGGESGRGGIFRAESASHHSMNGEKGLNFDSMTTADVRQAQKKHEGAGGATGAAGLFQIMPATLKEAVRKGKVPADMRWTRENQINVVGTYLLFDKRGDSVGAYLSGQSNDRTAAQEGMAAEFAGFKRPSGSGAYDGVQGNRATVSADEVGAALDKAREAYRQALPRGRDVAQAAAAQAMVAGGGAPKTFRLRAKDEAEAAAQVAAIKDPRERAVAQKALREGYSLFHARQAQEKQDYAAFQNGVREKLAMGGRLSASDRARLKPSDAYDLERYTWAVRNGREDALFQENRGSYLTLKMNPELLGSMDEAEILALETKFGAVKTAELVEAGKQIREAKVRGVKAQSQVKADVVNDIARLYKVDRKDDPERYHALTENVQALNDDLRVKLGREPTEQELLAEAKKMQAEKELKVKDGWFWEKTTRHRLEMTTAELRVADELKRKKEAGK